MTEINIYVKAIDTMESPYYEFYTDTVGTTELTPTNTLYTNNTYIFNFKKGFNKIIRLLFL